MKSLIILTTCVSLFSISAYSKEAYKVLPESKTCTVSCAKPKPVKTKKVKSKNKSSKKTSSYSKMLKNQANELKKMKARQVSLELELRKLREANLILTAKQDETPLANVSLASNTMAVPVEATIKKEIEIADVLEPTPSKWGVLLLDEVETAFTAPADGREMTNLIYNELTYKYSPETQFRISNSLAWNWVTPTGSQNEIKFGDPGIWAIFPLITNPEGFSLEMNLINDIGLSKESRDETKMVTTKIRFNIPTKFAGGNGSFKIRPEYAFMFRRYTTPEPTGSPDPEHTVEYNGSQFEKVDPYTKDSFYLRFDLNYKVTPKFSFCNEFRWKWARTYADSFTFSGNTYVNTQPGFTNKLVLKNYVAYQITDTVGLEAGVYNQMLVEDFVPFKNLNFVATLIYAI